VVVEAPVLHRDDRAREVLAEAAEAHRLAAPLNRELANLVPFGVIDVGVLHQLGVLAVEALPVLADHEPVRADGRYGGCEGHDQGELEEDPEHPQKEAEPTPLGSFLLVSKKLFTELPRTSPPQRARPIPVRDMPAHPVRPHSMWRKIMCAGRTARW